MNITHVQTEYDQRNIYHLKFAGKKIIFENQAKIKLGKHKVVMMLPSKSAAEEMEQRYRDEKRLAQKEFRKQNWSKNK